MSREEFLKSKEAYQVLSNVLERHEYDKLILGTIFNISLSNSNVFLRLVVFYEE